MANVFAKPDRPSVPDDTPVDGVVDEAISSNWAYDHNAAKTGVHAAGAHNLLNTGDVDDTPVDGVVDEAISSNWAYDHENDADVHHTQNTDTDLDATFKATLAKSGANSDITALSGLTTALTVAQGGSGAKTFADTAVLTGNVAGAFNASTLKVSDAGEATNASQPAFNAYLTANELDVTGDGTIWRGFDGSDNWTERYDQGNDFNGDGLFTAPITGRYILSGVIYVRGLLVAHTQVDFYIETSNRSYLVQECNAYTLSVNGGFFMNGTVQADMDINDGAYLRVIVSNGTKVVYIYATHTRFMGMLIC